MKKLPWILAFIFFVIAMLQWQCGRENTSQGGSDTISVEFDTLKFLTTLDLTPDTVRVPYEVPVPVIIKSAPEMIVDTTTLLECKRTVRDLVEIVDSLGMFKDYHLVHDDSTIHIETDLEVQGNLENIETSYYIKPVEAEHQVITKTVTIKQYPTSLYVNGGLNPISDHVEAGLTYVNKKSMYGAGFEYDYITGQKSFNIRAGIRLFDF